MKNANIGSFTTVKLQAISLRLIAIIALVAVIGMAVVSCGGGKIPNGKYVRGTSETYWEFSGNKATYHAHANFIEKGTYTIDKDGLFVFTKEDGSIEKKLFGLEGKELLLGSTTFTKQ